jgi:hypothetical protein
MAFRPSKVVGSAGGTTYAYGKDGKPFLTKEPKLLLNNNNAGKPEYIHLMVGAVRPRHSATRLATGRCWSTTRLATARVCRCSSCTMTPSANTPTVRRRGSLIPRLVASRRLSTTRRVDQRITG